MRDTKRRFEILQFYDSTGIKKHLEKMAEKGWLLEKSSNFGWVYRRIEPKKLQFAVSYYPKASEFDPEPSEEQQIFCDFCEHSGWKLATTWAQMQIFYNEQENPVPIDTDPVLEVERLHKAMKRNFIPSYIVLVILCLIEIGLLGQRFSLNFVEALANGTILFSGSIWVLLGIMCIVELVNYLGWYAKAKVAAEEGEFHPTKGCYWIQMFVLAWTIGGVILWLLSLFGENEFIVGIGSLVVVSLVMLLVNRIKFFLKKIKVSKNVNRTVTFISSFVLLFIMISIFTMIIVRGMISGTFEKMENPELETYEHMGETYTIKKDEVPLVVSDLMETDYDSYSTEWKETVSPFATQYKGAVLPKWGDNEVPSLTYTITKVKAAVLYDKCFAQLYHKYDYRNDKDKPKESWYKEMDKTLWNMDAAYERYMGDTALSQYLLCWDNYMAEINTDWEMTEQQMKIAGEKLQAAFN